MANNGNTQNNLAIQKQNLLNQKLGNTNYSNLEFTHVSSGGEKVINFNSLVQDPDSTTLEGFSNPLPSQLIGAKITENRGNVFLHSSARGPLQRFTQYYIRENNQIRLTYETEENEIITGMINNVIRTTPEIIDVKKISMTAQIVEGQTIINVGEEYNVNANPTMQIGDLIVHRWQGTETPKLLVRCEGNDIANDGNYIEEGTTIVLKEGGRLGGENIVIVSPNCIPTKPVDGFKQDLETLGGQVDAIAEWIQDVHGLTTNPFQVAPNQVDLRSFGQKVINLERLLEVEVAVNPIYQSFLGIKASNGSGAVTSYTNLQTDGAGLFSYDAGSGIFTVNKDNVGIVLSSWGQIQVTDSRMTISINKNGVGTDIGQDSFDSGSGYASNASGTIILNTNDTFNFGVLGPGGASITNIKSTVLATFVETKKLSELI